MTATSDTAGGPLSTNVRGAIPPRRIGGPARGFATPHAGASALWSALDWGFIYAAAHRLARRLGYVEPLDDLAHDIALETVIALGATMGKGRVHNGAVKPGRPTTATRRRRLSKAVSRAESVVELRYTPRGFRPQSAETQFPGARLTPGQWRDVFAWLRRVLPDTRADQLAKGGRRDRRILEATLRGESLPCVADRLGLTLNDAKHLRSVALVACRRALSREAGL